MRTRRFRRAQSLVEFSLIVPIFVLVLMGTIDFGRASYYYLVTPDLARTGARSAATYNNGQGFTDSQVVAAVKQQADAAAMANLTQVAIGGGCSAPPAPPAALQPCQQPPVGSTYIFIDRSATDYVTVSIVYTFQPVMPILSNITGTIYLRGASSMNLEYK